MKLGHYCSKIWLRIFNVELKERNLGEKAVD